MCGICGIAGPADRARAEAVEAMTATLHHRGPDDRGTWRGRFREGTADHEVAFGHTRLSIIDLSPLGHQPMSSADGQTTVTYNGEIYNYRELRDDLVSLGHTFRSESDTEVLLAAYQAWGDAAFERLVGMFALAIFDARHDRIVLARDRLGIKPLYWSYVDGLLLFGSELGALRAHPSFCPEIDRGALGRYLQHGYVSGEETIYASTRRLPPGHTLVVEGGSATQQAYWRLEDPEPDVPTTFEAAVEGLEERLGLAVEQRLVSDVPLGAFLSGGIDSSAVVSLMCERAGGRVRTFSIGFANREYDEAPHAKLVADHLGTDHTELYVDRDDAVGVARELPDLYDEPFADSSAIPTTLLSRLTRDHVTVALSGDGGDELLGGYDQYGKLARLLPLFRLPRPLRQALAAVSPLVPDATLRRGLGHLRARDEADLAERLVRHWSGDEAAAFCGEAGRAAREAYRRSFDSAPTADPVRRSSFADAATYLPDDILTKVDRATMSVALEAPHEGAPASPCRAARAA
ncbi:MAG: asparagine synthase (glutamine-hydrolyzing) [Deltaproteobacteria bacterium]|nr:asparagine synthase (glutamine-hydrolyzing) [Deltaproteobacteria bacterium]